MVILLAAINASMVVFELMVAKMGWLPRNRNGANRQLTKHGKTGIAEKITGNTGKYHFGNETRSYAVLFWSRSIVWIPFWLEKSENTFNCT